MTENLLRIPSEQRGLSEKIIWIHQHFMENSSLPTARLVVEATGGSMTTAQKALSAHLACVREIILDVETESEPGFPKARELIHEIFRIARRNQA